MVTFYVTIVTFFMTTTFNIGVNQISLLMCSGYELYTAYKNSCSATTGVIENSSNGQFHVITLLLVGLAKKTPCMHK